MNDRANNSTSNSATSLLLPTVGFWILATLVGIALSGQVSFNSSFAFSSLPWFKSVLYLMLLAGVMLLPAVANYWRNTSSPERAFIGGLVFCLIVGQTAGQSRGLFPFVEWDMYTHSVDLEDAVVIEYVGVTNGGERVLLNPGQIFPALGFGTLRYQNGLRLLVRGGLTPAGGAAQHEFFTRLDASLLSMRQQYNRRNPDETLTDVEVYLSNVVAAPRIQPVDRKLAYSTSVADRSVPLASPDNPSTL